MLVTKKPRKPRTKKKLEEGIIIEENLDNPLEPTEMLVTKKPRKPRTKKKKLEEGIIIEDENPLQVENPLETQQLVTKKPRKPRTKKLEEGIIIEENLDNPLETTEMLVTKKPRKPRTKKKLDEGIIIEDEPIGEPVKSQEQQRIY
jgi:hypothetical protein